MMDNQIYYRVLYTTLIGLIWLPGLHAQESSSEMNMGDTGSESLNALATKALNPVAKMISVPFQNNLNYGVGPDDDTQYVLDIQPVVPFTLSENTFTRGSYKADFDFDEDDYNIRALQHVALEVEGKKLHILNHHGHHIDAHKLGDDETLRQTSMIIDYIKKLDGAVILCGDFNLSPESESIKQFDSVLKNLSVDYSLETTRSLLTYKNEVCDYIFVNDEVDIKDFSMDQTIISDHNALILDFKLK